MERRFFLRGLGALVAVALCKPVEALVPPPREVLSCRPLDVDNFAEALKELYRPEAMEWVAGSSAFLRILPGAMPDQIFLSSSAWSQLVRLAR